MGKRSINAHSYNKLYTNLQSAADIQGIQGIVSINVSLLY